MSNFLPSRPTPFAHRGMLYYTAHERQRLRDTTARR